VRSARTRDFETARRNPDGSVTVDFGGDPKQPNYLRIMPGWIKSSVRASFVQCG